MKTRANSGSVAAFLDTIEHPRRLADAKTLLTMMHRITGEPPVMWGTSMIGFGSYHYTYESGREGDSFRVGFSPRKQALSIYVVPGFDVVAALLPELGKHKIGKSCLYVNRLDDIDLAVLERLLICAHQEMNRRYPT